MFRIVVFCLALSYALGKIPHVLVDKKIKLDGLPYIVQGENAEEGKYPYQASLYTPMGGPHKLHECGATILTKNWIVTAAHCCATPRYNVMVGSIYISKGGQTHKLDKYIQHPKYETKAYWRNDICLIKTATPIQFSNTVQPAKLPPQGKELKDGELVTVSGWGYTTPEGRVSPDRLQVGKNFKFVQQSRCSSLTNVTAFEGFFCVAGNRPGQGICQGDSGGPVAKDGVLYGVASFIFMPCGNVLPDYFVRVANYINWIKQTLGPDAKDLVFST